MTDFDGCLISKPKWYTVLKASLPINFSIKSYIRDFKTQIVITSRKAFINESRIISDMASRRRFGYCNIQTKLPPHEEQEFFELLKVRNLSVGELARELIVKSLLEIKT